MTALLSVEGLTVRLPVDGEMRTVLTDIDLELGEGQALALVGESGSGKSMTVRAIDRLLPPNAEVEGAIRLNGTDVRSLKAAALKRYRAEDVAMIFQDPRMAINPVRRIGDFLTEGMRLNRGMSAKAARSRAVQLLEQVGVADGERRLRQYPHELSGGLLQRVMIAAVVAAEPKLILADEPTTALDVTTQAEVVRILGELRREHGMAMLFITHDLELASGVCDRTAVMYAGQIVERQRSRQLHQEPLHPYTAGLLLSRPDVNRRAPRLVALPGSPTTAYDAPAGCSFAPRCAHAADGCESPQELVEVGDGRGSSRCHRTPELRGRLTSAASMEGTEGVTA